MCVIVSCFTLVYERTPLLLGIAVYMRQHLTWSMPAAQRRGEVMAHRDSGFAGRAGACFPLVPLPQGPTTCTHMITWLSQPRCSSQSSQSDRVQQSESLQHPSASPEVAHHLYQPRGQSADILCSRCVPVDINEDRQHAVNHHHRRTEVQSERHQPDVHPLIHRDLELGRFQCFVGRLEVSCSAACRGCCAVACQCCTGAATEICSAWNLSKQMTTE